MDRSVAARRPLRPSRGEIFREAALPEWMRLAIEARIISEAEAQEILRICLGAEEEFVTMPRHLNTACERILLWELEAAPTVH